MKGNKNPNNPFNVKGSSRKNFDEMYNFSKLRTSRHLHVRIDTRRKRIKVRLHLKYDAQSTRLRRTEPIYKTISRLKE